MWDVALGGQALAAAQSRCVVLLDEGEVLGDATGLVVAARAWWLRVKEGGFPLAMAAMTNPPAQLRSRLAVFRDGGKVLGGLQQGW